MAYSDFDKLKAFLTELKNANYRPERMRSRVPGRGAWTTINKAECFDLLRKKIPELTGKDDNYLTKYLSAPRNIKNRLLAEFTTAERVALEQSLAEEISQVQPPAGQPTGGEAAAGQMPPPIAQGTPPGGIPGMGMPSVPSVPTVPRIRIVHNVPQAVSGMGDGMGTGTAAGSKIDRLEVERVGAATAKGNRLAVNAPITEPPRPPLSSSPRINFAAIRSKVGGRVAGAARASLERANPFLGRMGNGLLRGLTGIANPGGIGGAGSRSIIGRFSRFGRGGGRGMSSVAKVGRDRGKWVFILSLLGMMLLVGLFTITSQPPAPTPPPLPPPTGSDISNCKFSRAGVSMKFESPLLLGYIKEASQKSSIPAVVLASFIRVESPSSSDMQDYQISGYAANCAVSPTGALGIMQIQPPGTTSLRGDPASCDDCIDAGARLVGKTFDQLTRDDYCDPRTNIIVGAGWILKKLSHLGLGDGSRWDPAWTNDTNAIKTLVNTYYGCLDYGGPTDCTGPYNYADDVSTSIRNCQSTPLPSLPPGTDISCPVVDGVISCASYGQPYTGGGAGAFTGNCGIDSSGNGGHCNNIYQATVGICLNRTDSSGNLIRTAKSIDISSPSGDTAVYLPTIRGQSLNWIYQGYVNAGQDFGEIRLFKSEPTSDGVWSIHFVHVEGDYPPLDIGDKIPSGARGVKMINMGAGTHVHVTVGLNVDDSLSDLKDYSPNWLFADRDLNMCIK